VTLKAVVFDIGGVLEHAPATGWQDRWAARLGLERPELEERLEEPFSAGSVGTIDLPEVERRVGAALALDVIAVAELMDDLWAEYMGRLNEELAGYFASLRPRYRTGILSNSFVGAREREQAAYGFADMCDVTVYSHEEGMMKPDPRFYEVVCQRLGVRADETLFLDDTQMCVDGARRVGMTAIRFIDNTRALAELEAHLGGGR
jgi:epoxide hydrolase-like predicted phosphatase